MSSMSTGKDPRGRLLKVKIDPVGRTQVIIDNGPFNTITIHGDTTNLYALLGSNLEQIRAHLMTRAPGHFRKKSGKR
jgi:hypothetical protein